MTVLRALVAVGLMGCGVALLAAAPVPKVAPLPPPTEAQLEASRENLKQIAIAGHSYEAVSGELPNNIHAKDGRPLLSWRVHLLPYLEELPLYQKLRLDEPWDSPHNARLIPLMPKVFAPVRVKAEPGQTFYRGFTGAGTPFEARRRVRIADIVDGCSNTLWVVEAGEPVVWTKPDDLPFDPKKPLPRLGGLFDGEFHFATVDGAVHRARKDFDAAEFRKLLDRGDGQVIDLTRVVR